MKSKTNNNKAKNIFLHFGFVQKQELNFETFPEHCLEEATSCCKNHSVSLKLASVLAHQGHIREVDVTFRSFEMADQVLLEIIPLQTEAVRLC